jgi:hypothetical protein
VIRALKIAVLALAILFLSCNKKEEPVTDTKEYPEFLVFGFVQSCDFPSDACKAIFKMEPGRIDRASNLDVPDGSAPYAGHYDQHIPSSKYQQIEPLFKDKIPRELLDMDSGIVGNESTFYTYFEYKSDRIYKYWLLSNSGGLPLAIQPFFNTVNQAWNIAITQ